MADEILCPRCHAANAVGTAFCAKCGTSLEEQNAKAQEDPLLGAFVGERFMVKRKLGEGGMGVVYEADQTAIDRKVALKVLHPHLTDESLYARFRNEAAASSRLGHPNTITVYDFGKTETGSLYIAMEFIEGKSLDDEIVDDGAMDWRRVCKIGAQICGSLQDAHNNGIVHRDLKPENVMLCERGGDKDVVKVLDFGIAKIMEDDGQDQRKALTKTGMVFGTPQYMSPEQVRGEKVDARSDIYSTGIILYQMITGMLPFKSETPMGVLTMHLLDVPPAFGEALPGLQFPAGLEELIMQTLAKAAEDRPQTMKELGDKLEAIGAGQAVGAAAATAAVPAGGRPTAVTQPTVETGAGQTSAPVSTGAPVPSTVEGPSPSPAIPPVAAKKGKGGLIAGIIIGAVVLLGGGGAAAWYFLMGPGSVPDVVPIPGPQIAGPINPPPVVPPNPNGMVPPIGNGVIPQVPTTDTGTATAPEDLSAAPPDETDTGEESSGESSGAKTSGKKPKKKDTNCVVTPVNGDKIAKAMADKLKSKEKAIKDCAKLVKDKGGSIFNFQVKNNANKPSSVQSKPDNLSRCLRQQVESDFGEKNDKPRKGQATFAFERKQGALSQCKVTVGCQEKKVREKKPAGSSSGKKPKPGDSRATFKPGVKGLKGISVKKED